MADTDLLVVGGGTAGCVVAALCSVSLDVMMVEAGAALDGAHRIITHGPNFHRAFSLEGRRWDGETATGRGIGGSSVVNAMVARFGELDRVGAGAGDRLDRSIAAVHERGPLAGALAVAAARHGLRAAPLLLTRRATGERSSVVGAYLEPALAHGRVVTLTDALVDRVIIEGGVVRGVRLADGRTITARRVVVAAGAVRTPAVLLRSRIDRPGIGQGLQDHPGLMFPLRYRLPLDPSSLDRMVSVAVGASGDVCAPGDLQVLAADAVSASTATLVMMLLRSRSVGSVRLASDDPSADPIVNLAVVDEDDIDAVKRAEEQVRYLLADPDMEAVVEVAGPPSAGGIYHVSGTCRPGGADDRGAVVDDMGRVHGVEGLWVADASILPGVPPGSVHIAVVRAAERVAGHLLASAGASKGR